jgi:hypothetical protein
MRKNFWSTKWNVEDVGLRGDLEKTEQRFGENVKF